MEKKKLLLVIVSVGIFLVVVIGASILVFSPKSRISDAMAFSPSPISAGTTGNDQAQAPEPSSADPTEWIRNPQTVQGLQTPQQPAATTRGDVIIIYGDNTIQGRTMGHPKPAEISAGSGALIIEVPKPGVAPAPSPAPPAPAPAPAPTVTPSVPPQRTPTVVRPAPQPRKGTQTRVHNDHWIQTGAFSTKARAEGVQATLAARGITSVLDIKALQERTFFRVRVGPYATKNEADYWLSLIRSIEGFGESYVSLVRTRR